MTSTLAPALDLRDVHSSSSAGECAAVCSALASRGLAPIAARGQARAHLHEVVCMLAALARNARLRAMPA